MAEYKTSIIESALLLGRDESLVGVLTESQSSTPDVDKKLTGVLLLNAGLIHHIGPNRIYVKLARLLAGMGYVVLRFDFSGIGDSGPRKDKMPVVESVVEECRKVMDHIERLRGIKKFVLVGVCAGAANAFRMATIDQRVINIVMINPLLPATQQVERMKQASHYRHRAIFSPKSWIKLLLMKVNYRSMFQVFGYEIKKLFIPRSVLKEEPQEITNTISNWFKSLSTRNIKVLMINSAEDIGWKYFKEILGPDFKTMVDSGILKTQVLMGSDHTVTPLKCQDELQKIISDWISENC